MKINDANRPKDITSDAIWEIYKRLCEMEKRYVFYYNTQGCRQERRRYLCYVEGIGIGADDTEYDDRDPMGITMPYQKLEWVYLSLVTMKNGKLCHWDTKLSQNVLYRQPRGVEGIIENSKVSFPTPEELSPAEFVEAQVDGGEIALIPSVHYDTQCFWRI
ncbi:MAG: hypothetical protein K5678_05230 [Acetatifactor sp.]|nr:hypothetical protein [Acetatifactor sp.]